ncbi:MAG: hypothetical protein RLZZ618_1480 [Pseudomonadota bacterium]
MEDKPPFPSLTSALLLCVALFIIEQLMMAVGVDLRGVLGLTDMQIVGLAVLLSYGILLSSALALQGRSYRQLFHESTHDPRVVLGVVTLPVLMLVPAVLVLSGWINMLVTAVFPTSAWEADAFEQMANGSFASVLMGVVLAPVLEEMLFRGVILRGFLQRYPPPVAIVHSAAIFGLAHLNVYQFCGAMFIGLLLGWLYERTRSLWPCILLHAGYNSAVLWMSLPDGSGKEMGEALTSGSGVLAALLLALWAGHRLRTRLG